MEEARQQLEAMRRDVEGLDEMPVSRGDHVGEGIGVSKETTENGDSAGHVPG